MTSRNKILITVFFIILTISSLFTYWMKSKEDTFADEIISNASTSFKTNLNDFLSSVELSVDALNNNIKQAGNEQFKSDNLNIFFSKMILEDSYLKGVVLAHNKFSYVIYQDNSTWATTYDMDLTDSVTNWKRLNNKLETVSEWTDTYSFFLDNHRLTDISNQLSNSKYLWKTSKSQLPDNRDLFTNIYETVNNDGEKIIVGLIFSTQEISKHFRYVLKFENPLVSIITTNHEIVTPIVTTDTSVVSAYNELSPEIERLILNWKESQNMGSHSYSFEKFNKIFWSRIEELNQNVGVIGFAVTISSDDLSETERKQELIYLYVSIILIVITIILAFMLFRKKKSGNQSIGNNDLAPLDDDEIMDMIKSGETEFVEFKSSIRWDYREEKVNKILEDVILKTIAAFANAKGGTLLIGVTDDLEIIGLEKDFSTLKKQDADYFELHTRKLINNRYGIAFSNENLLMRFPVFNGNTICSIQVKASENPIFSKTKNKQGNEIEKFYVRSGNASQEISSMKEVNDYINVRFKK